MIADSKFLYCVTVNGGTKQMTPKIVSRFIDSFEVKPSIIKLPPKAFLDPDLAKQKAAEAERRIKDVDGQIFNAGKNLGLFVTIGEAATDEDIKLASALPGKVTSLSLKHSNITDKGLANLKYLPYVSSLDVSYTKVTDAGLKYLKGARALRILNMAGTAITNTELEQLHNLPYLEELTLMDTKVTGAGIPKLQGLKNLKMLSLDSLPITDTDLEKLASLPDLTTLSLARTKITDQGLRQVAKLRNLEALVLVQTNTTKKGVAELKKTLPNLMVFGK